MRSVTLNKGTSVGFSSVSTMGVRSVPIIAVADMEIKENLLVTNAEADTLVDKKKEDETDINCQDFLTFDRFYHGFMQPYFGCYRCQTTKNAFKMLTMTGDNSGTIEWSTFEAVLNWVLNQYGSEIIDAVSNGLASNYREEAEILLKLTFEKAIIPLIRERINADKNPFNGSNFIFIQPKNYAKHTATVIVLHGLANFDESGGNGDFWFNQFNISRVHTLYPHVRFVFPTADKLAITDMNYCVKPAWFDVKHKNDPENGFKNLSGLYDSVSKVKKLIKQEMNVYDIPSERIIIFGFSQGGTIALLTALEMQEKFAAISCAQTLLLGKNKTEWTKSMHLQINSKKQKNTPIFWLDNKVRPIKCYENLSSEYGKECFDYLKKECQLNVSYKKFDKNPTVLKQGEKQSMFQILLGELINTFLPPLK